MKNGVNWKNGFAIAAANPKNCPSKCLIFQTNEESLSNGNSCIQDFLFEVRFYFSSKKGH